MLATPRNFAEVTKADRTVTTYARCTVDEFTHNTLTVESIDDGRVVDTFPPGTWREATAYGANGYPTHTFTTTTLQEQS